MSKVGPERETHKAWLGLLQPVGLVVAAPALIKAQAVLDNRISTALPMTLEGGRRRIEFAASRGGILIEALRFTSEAK